MGLYERLENERIGEETRRKQSAETRGSEIARQQLDRAAQIEAEKEAQALNEAEMQSNAFAKGREEERLAMLNSMMQSGYLGNAQVDPNSIMMQDEGLGMGSQTVDSMIQQEQVGAEAMEEAAMGVIQDLGNAQAQGASPEELEQMFQSIPDELKGKVMEMKQMADQSQQTEQNATMPQPADTSGATAYSKDLLSQI